MQKTVPLTVLVFTFLLNGVAHTETIYGLSVRNQILTFDSATPGQIQSSKFITGIAPTEEIINIDFRPATGELYGLGSHNRLYRLDTLTAAATLIGTGFSPQLNGIEFGFDFNPTVDRIRLTSDLDQNLRLHPVTGAGVATDGSLAYAAGDPNAGMNPNIVGSAYTNNFSGATSTVLYNIDSGLDILVTQIPPNSGTLNTVGSLGVDTSGLVGFDIAQSNGVAYASLTGPTSPFSALYTINLTTGAATFVGAIGNMQNPLLIRDISVIAVPEPATWLALAAGSLLAFLRRRR